MEKIKVINITDEDEFEREINKWLLQGYKVSSSSCGFVNSESYDFCTSFQAILIKEC